MDQGGLDYIKVKVQILINDMGCGFQVVGQLGNGCVFIQIVVFGCLIGNIVLMGCICGNVDVFLMDVVLILVEYFCVILMDIIKGDRVWIGWIV